MLTDAIKLAWPDAQIWALADEDGWAKILKEVRGLNNGVEIPLHCWPRINGERLLELSRELKFHYQPTTGRLNMVEIHKSVFDLVGYMYTERMVEIRGGYGKRYCDSSGLCWLLVSDEAIVEVRLNHNEMYVYPSDVWVYKRK